MTQEELNNFIYNYTSLEEDGLEFINNFFAKQIEYINARMMGGKISPEKAHKKFKKIFKKYKDLYEKVEDSYE